jgi:hypothetical protein
MASLFPTLIPAGPVGDAGSTGAKSSQVAARFVTPLPDQRVTVPVTDMHVGQVLYCEDLGYFEVSAIHNSVNVTLRNLTSEFRPVVQRNEIHDVIDYDS